MNTSENNSAGWDIGGAHIKLALLTDKNMRVFQWYCPLWRGIQELDKILQVALNEMKGEKFKHYVTMTGELVDCFSSKADGVRQIMNTFVNVMNSQNDIQFFTQQKMLNHKQAVDAFEAIASANWLASGMAIARVTDDALFIDMGSTTTDLLMIKNAQVKNFGNSDFERLRSGELVYTGVVRSCVNTISTHLLYRDELIPMMAEYFSNTADVYRILNLLPAHADLGETCDGSGKDINASVKRLARMIGVDVHANNPEDNQVWQAAAMHIAQQQKQMLARQVQKFFTEYGCEKKIVGAGVGRYLVKELALELAVEYVDFSDLVVGNKISVGAHAADCAPAVSLAMSD